MDVERDLGQMFVVGFLGCEVPPTHWLATAIQRDRLGGVILFDRNVDGSIQNIQSPGQLKDLIREVQQHAEIPLFVAVDQEGGKVCRLKERDGFAPMPGAAQLGLEGLEATSRQAEILARQLAALGVNLNFAPVVDLDLNPGNPIIARYGRSFGADPKLVTAHAQAFIQAHHQHRVCCCLKHFPGHGSAGLDSHVGFVEVTECWQQEELSPYRQLIAQGYDDGIMTAHLVHRGLDPTGVPATLSAPMVTGLLRQELGFGGVIFSDDLQMRAITKGWSYIEAVQQAVLAGVDVLVVGNNLTPVEDAVTAGIKAIRALLESGQITATRLQASLARIAQLKKRIIN